MPAPVIYIRSNNNTLFHFRKQKSAMQSRAFVVGKQSKKAAYPATRACMTLFLKFGK